MATTGTIKVLPDSAEIARAIREIYPNVPVIPMVEKVPAIKWENILKAWKAGEGMSDKKLASLIRKFPHANVAFLAGPLSAFILDADCAEGIETMKRLCGGHLPYTPTVASRGRADLDYLHFNFRYPAGFEVKNGVKRLPGLDWRAVGGYAMAPGFVRADGRVSEWILHPRDVRLAAMPKALEEFLREYYGREKPPPGEVKTYAGGALSPYAQKALSEECARVAGTPEGARHDRLSSVTRYQRHPQNGTINRELAVLKRAFRLGVECDPPLVAKVPKIKLLAEAPARSGFFEVDQFAAIVAQLPEYLRAPLEVARTTGWRIASEVLTRKAKHLDLATGWLRLDPGETKNSEGREFPLTPQLRAVLVAQRERTRTLERERGIIVPWLFHDDAGRRIGNFRGLWLGACKRAGIRKLPHDLRRTAIRNLERAGIARSAAMKMVGHKTESVYRRYAIADSKVLEEAAVKLPALQASEVAETRKAATAAESDVPLKVSK